MVIDIPEDNLDALMVIVGEVLNEYLPVVIGGGLLMLLDPELREGGEVKRRVSKAADLIDVVDKRAHAHLHRVHSDHPSPCSIDTGDPLAFCREVLRLAIGAYVMNDAHLYQVAKGVDYILCDLVMSSSVALKSAPVSSLTHISEVSSLIREVLSWIDDPQDTLQDLMENERIL